MTPHADPTPKIIAHRGASGLAPENTLPAFEAAIQSGADGMEFDVLLSADGVPVVHHDYRLSSSIARRDNAWIKAPGPAIGALTAKALAEYDVGRIRPGGKYAKRYPDYAPADGARIPTLQAVLDLVKATAPDNFELWIELKINPTKPDVSPDPMALADITIDALRRAGLLANVVFVSFYWPALAHIAETTPGAKLAFNTAERPWLDNLQLGGPGASPWLGRAAIADEAAIPAAIQRLGGAVWSAFYLDMTPARMAAARALGLKVGVWTVRNETQRRRAAKLRPDVIITDRPDWRHS